MKKSPLRQLVSSVLFPGMAVLLLAACTQGAPPEALSQSLRDPNEDPTYYYCGDGLCHFETCSTCPDDCGPCNTEVCGNGVCGGGETCSTCAADCGACPPAEVCGNGSCAGSENCSNCPADCGACPPNPCGNGVCDADETCSSCSLDCGTCPETCGNGVCGAGENCNNCLIDCGQCSFCGDFSCNFPSETCDTCPADCGTCPWGGGVCNNNGVCSALEDCGSCPSDCCSGGGGWYEPCQGNWNCGGGFGCGFCGRSDCCLPIEIILQQ